MKKDIKDLFKNSQKSYNNLISNFNLSNFDVSNLGEINIEIKHILEDLRSVYDYIAADINDLYCHLPGKIYFPYAEKDVNQEKFINKLSKKFPNVPTDIINLIINIQHFKYNKEWLITLMKLTNKVKHIELSINKVRVEKKTTYTDGEASMIATGDIKMVPYNNGYAICGTGKIYVNSGNVSFYGNGTVSVGSGILDINNPSKSNLDITFEERNVLQFKLIEKDVYDVLNEIFNETQAFLIKLEEKL